MSILTIEGITKRYGSITAVDDVSLSVRDGEILCLLGPSGCGKSTTLRMMAGLETPSEGHVYLDEQDVTDQPAYRRDSAMVFQNWALFPYKSVLENVAFGLKMKGVDKTERYDRAREMLELIQMSEYEEQSPTSLSGGQQQRVALARALTMDPQVLLLDEPLSSLDKRLREQMQIELKEIHERFEKTMIHVTHDQDEAFTLADRIGIMNDGRLVQIGKPRDVYRNPRNKFVEEFLGDTNFLAGTVENGTGDAVRLETDFGEALEIDLSESGGYEIGERVSVSLRPELLHVEATDDPTDSDATETDQRNAIFGTVTNKLYRGSTVRYYIDVNGFELFAERSVGDQDELTEGDGAVVSWDSQRTLCFDGDGERIGVN